MLRVAGELRFATRRTYSLRFILLPSEVENNEPKEPTLTSTLPSFGKILLLIGLGFKIPVGVVYLDSPKDSKHDYSSIRIV